MGCFYVHHFHDYCTNYFIVQYPAFYTKQNDKMKIKVIFLKSVQEPLPISGTISFYFYKIKIL